MNAHEIHDCVKRQVDYLVKEGMSAMHTDAAIGKTIVEKWVQHGDYIHEDIQLVFLMLLVTFELRRREIISHPEVH